MADNQFKTIQVVLKGLRPLMFDRYAGDNNTTLPPEEKMYLDDQSRLIIPAINVYSLLTAENSKSVTRQFFGRQGKTIGLGISSYTNIEPFEIPILDANGPIVFQGWNGQLSVRKDVARVKGGIPNPKTRPVLALPWSVAFTVEYQENTYCTLENLRQAFAMGGTLGLGTFRPYFGRYELTGWSY
jgi:hypothetical protein